MTTTAGFDRGARNYDLMVGFNPGYHRELRRAAEALTEKLATHQPKCDRLELLDLACGSGASTAALAAALRMGHELRPHGDPARTDRPRPEVSLTGVDASTGMLAQARAKTWPPGVDFTHGVVGRLDDTTLGPRTQSDDDPGHDGILACYLFRNVPAEVREHAVAEVFGLLRPGGWLVVQEYAVAGSRSATWLWTMVCWLAIIPLGTAVDRDSRLYRYLWRSVLDFEALPRFADRLVSAGFTEVSHRTASGWQRGILHTIIARRPEES